MNNWIEEDSEVDDFTDEQSGSETENDESQTSDADDEIDLEDLRNYSYKTFLLSRLSFSSKEITFLMFIDLLLLLNIVKIN